MSSHHDHDHHSNEPKPVAFRTPMILGLVTMLAIVLLVSTCAKKHGCCEGEEKCEASCETKHGGHEEHAAASTEHNNVEGHEHDVLTEEAAAVADSILQVDSAAAKPVEAAHH